MEDLEDDHYVRPLSTEGIPTLRYDGSNRAKWGQGIRGTCIQAGYDDFLTIPLPDNPSVRQRAIQRNVYGLILRTIDHALADTIMRERGNAREAWQYLRTLGATTTSYSILKAHPAPPLAECPDVDTFLHNHRMQRNALLAANPADHLARIQHSMHLVLDGLPAEEPAVYSLQVAFDAKAEDSFTIDDIEALYKSVQRLPTSPPYAASATRGRAGRHQPRTSRTKGQPPGREGLTYNCMYCRADNHHESDCGRKQRGDPGLFHNRNPRANRPAPTPTANHTAVDTDPGMEAATEALNRVVSRLDQLFTTSVNESTQYTAFHALLRRARAKMAKFGNICISQPVERSKRAKTVKVDSIRFLPPALDSAASHTMVRTKSELARARPVNIAVRMANNSTTRATAAGTALLTTGRVTVQLPNALHVPSLTRTLIAVCQLARLGTIMITGNRFWHTKTQPPPDRSQIIAEGSARNGVYEFTESPPNPGVVGPTAAPVSAAPKNKFVVPVQFQHAHNVWNHLSMPRIRRAPATARPSSPTETVSAHTSFQCQPCFIGKATRAPHSTRSKCTVRLHKVSADVVGPFQPSIASNKYACLLIDEHTSYVAGIVARTKGAVAKPLVNTLRVWQHQTQQHVDIIHVDNAKELCMGHVKQWADSQGTEITTTVPNHCASNGQAERIIRTLSEAATTALAHAGLPPRYWDLALQDAADKHNVYPRGSDEKSSPHELMHGAAPPTDHFQPFGQYGFVVNTTNDRNPIRPRAVLCRYLRALNHHKYQVLQIHSNRIVTCRPSEFSPTQPPHCSRASPHFTHSDMSRVPLPAAPHPDTPSPPPPVTAASSIITDRVYNPKHIADALRRPDGPQWAQAHDACIDRNFALGAWVPCDKPDGVHLVQPIWQYKAKTGPDGMLEKRSARCAVRGDLMEPGVHYDPDRTAAQTPSHSGLRIFYAAAARAGDYIESYDVPGAYPRADTDPDYVVYMRQPARADGSMTYPGKVMRLDKAQQGAPDAGHRWEKHRNVNFADLGWTVLKSEPSAYYITEGRTYARLLASTDDFIISSNSLEYLAKHRAAFRKLWDVTVQSPVQQHAGIKVDITSHTIKMSVPKHIDNLLAEAGMTHSNPVTVPHIDKLDMSARREDEAPQTPESIREFQRLIGGARYIADTVGYCIAHATSALAKHMADPSTRHWQALKHLLRYLAGHRDLGITYERAQSPPDPNATMEAWVDSDWAQCKDTRRSRTGVVFTYAGDVVHYRSSMQKTVALSSSEAEYVAAAVAARDVKWFRALAAEWHIPIDGDPTALKSRILRIDNTGAIAMSTANGPTRRSKHIDISHHFLNEMVQKREILPQKIGTNDQKADMFTKSLPRIRFMRNMAALQGRAQGSTGGVGTRTHNDPDPTLAT